MISILKKIFGREKLEDNVSLANKEAKPVKEIARRLSLEEVREKERTIPKSSCGCYRHGARELFGRELDNNVYRTIELYEILSPKLHSYCNSTKSSYSSSNMDVVRRAFYATREILSDAKNENLEEIIKTQSNVISDLRQDCSGVNYLFNIGLDKDLQSLIQSAINLGNTGRYYESILILSNADKLAKAMKLDTQKEVISDLKKSYLPLAIKEIKDNDKELKVKAGMIYRLGNVFSNEGIGKKLLDKAQRLNSLVNKPMSSGERLGSDIWYYFEDNKIRPLERSQREIKSNLERNISKINEETENKRNSLLEKINYLKRFEINDNTLEKMMDYEKELVSLKNGYQERIDKLKSEETIKLNEIGNELDLVRKERDNYINKIKARKLTKLEYKSLLTQTRFKERKNDL